MSGTGRMFFFSFFVYGGDNAFSRQKALNISPENYFVWNSFGETIAGSLMGPI